MRALEGLLKPFGAIAELKEDGVAQTLERIRATLMPLRQ